jgi:hypothetical protein
VLLLAFSLPFSTILILAILSSGAFFAHTSTLVTAGLILICLGAVPNALSKVFVKMSKA